MKKKSIISLNDQNEIFKMIESNLDEALSRLDGILGNTNGVYNDLNKEFVSRPNNFSLATFRSKLKRFVHTLSSSGSERDEEQIRKDSKGEKIIFEKNSSKGVIRAGGNIHIGDKIYNTGKPPAKKELGEKKSDIISGQADISKNQKIENPFFAKLENFLIMQEFKPHNGEYNGRLLSYHYLREMKEKFSNFNKEFDALDSKSFRFISEMNSVLKVERKTIQEMLKFFNDSNIKGIKISSLLEELKNSLNEIKDEILVEIESARGNSPNESIKNRVLFSLQTQNYLVIDELIKLQEDALSVLN